VAYGQESPDTILNGAQNPSPCQPQDISDLIRKKGQPPKPLKAFNALIFPNVSSNPTNGFILGAGAALGWYMGDPKTTSVSNANISIALTTKNQLISFIKPNIYSKDDRFFLQGDWRYYIYSAPTYGLGTNSPDSGSVSSQVHWEGYGGPADSIYFPMEYNYIKFHQVFSMRVKGDFYAGLGYHLDYYYSIKDIYLDYSLDPPLETPHHYHSSKYGFDTSGYTLSGLSVNFVYDTRDNMINPYKGIYANMNFRYNETWLGSDQGSTQLWVEFRYYKGLSKRMPRNVIGFWLTGNFTTSGNLPYLTLPYLGDDQRARAGRAYTNGRYRGMNMIYAETEWRFPISKCSQILGGVLFVNAVTADAPDKGQHLFDYIQPGFGFGIRLMVNKQFRTNINLDFAIGQKSQGFYFSGQETF
jgi:hypothetical protein